MKGGCYNITFSWNKYMGDDGVTNPNSFVRQQLNLLEANPSAYPMYNSSAPMASASRTLPPFPKVTIRRI